MLLIIIGIDGIGLSKHLCDSDLGSFKVGFTLHQTDLECASEMRIILYISWAVALVTVVPIQILLVSLFEATHDLIVND